MMNKDKVISRQIASAFVATVIGIMASLVVTEVAWTWFGIGTIGAVTASGIWPALNLVGVIAGTAASAVLAVICMVVD